MMHLCVVGQLLLLACANLASIWMDGNTKHVLCFVFFSILKKKLLRISLPCRLAGRQAGSRSDLIRVQWEEGGTERARLETGSCALSGVVLRAPPLPSPLLSAARTASSPLLSSPRLRGALLCSRFLLFVPEPAAVSAASRRRRCCCGKSSPFLLRDGSTADFFLFRFFFLFGLLKCGRVKEVATFQQFPATVFGDGLETPDSS